MNPFLPGILSQALAGGLLGNPAPPPAPNPHQQAILGEILRQAQKPQIIGYKNQTEPLVPYRGGYTRRMIPGDFDLVPIYGRPQY